MAKWGCGKQDIIYKYALKLSRNKKYPNSAHAIFLRLDSFGQRILFMSDKTNVVRIFESKKIKCKFYTYDSDGAISGVEVAKQLGQNPEKVFKTLVAVGKSGKNYVFMIPVAEELDLKKAAAAVGEKSIGMLKQKDLLPTTGYVHGGCSPVGMKKRFATIIDSSAENFDTIIYSAGKIGFQVETSLDELGKVVAFTVGKLVI